MTGRVLIPALTFAGAGVLVLSGCVAKTDVAASGALTVSSTASGCDVSSASATSGTLTFDVSNDGEEVTEFYLLADDGLRIVGEVENIAPGASPTLTAVAQPGDYFTLCKPGLVDDGVGRAAFSVAGDEIATTGADTEQKQQAVDLYAAFVKDQVGQLAPAVAKFVAAYQSGDDTTARAQYPVVRAYYERIEPVAEALGDLDPRIDYREVDAVAEGLDWTGFHRIEKDLWVPARDALNADSETPAWQDWAPSTPEERVTFGDQLAAYIHELYGYVHSDRFEAALNEQGIAGISNGAIALLDEVATGKIQAEEDWWSGTDLSDFAANVQGSKMAYSLVREVAASQGDDGEALANEINARYADLEAALARRGSIDAGFVVYTELTDKDKRELTDLINALAEPLAQLTNTILA